MQQPVDGPLAKIRSEVGPDEGHLLPVDQARHIAQPFNLHHAHTERFNDTKHVLFPAEPAPAPSQLLRCTVQMVGCTADKQVSPPSPKQ